ncbi:maestro heat-like repeat-containing protein family member 2A [Mauremys reevesii]|uniref:maestro heat-like repeat-containing protein family member 2A n=1 Tax=Mauremys reevesii TaxID=260615 RepID=UPI00193FB29E|nr:maestro heat-like repeat-containing protein family member 2A [Mauremys reevesii]
MADQDKDKIGLRIAAIVETKLASVVRVLLEKLQQDEQHKVDIYCILEKVLQQDTGDLERGLLNKIIALASNHMRETQEATNEVKVAASNMLVTLARCYFDDVMYELHCYLKPPKLPDEFILITLGNLSSAYDIDECRQNPDICSPKILCINTNGSYWCKCRAGYIPSNGNTTLFQGR